MPLVPAKCPECGGLVEVDNEKRAGFCQHCGEPFVIEDAINTFNTYFNTTNNYNTTHNYGDGAVVNIYEDENRDFVIVAGVLKGYNGESQDIVIPENVKSIAADCFKGISAESITLNKYIDSIQFLMEFPILKAVKIVDENPYFEAETIETNTDKYSIVREKPSGNILWVPNTAKEVKLEMLNKLISLAKLSNPILIKSIKTNISMLEEKKKELINQKHNNKKVERLKSENYQIGLKWRKLKSEKDQLGIWAISKKKELEREMAALEAKERDVSNEIEGINNSSKINLSDLEIDKEIKDTIDNITKLNEEVNDIISKANSNSKNIEEYLFLLEDSDVMSELMRDKNLITPLVSCEKTFDKVLYQKGFDVSNVDMSLIDTSIFDNVAKLYLGLPIEIGKYEDKTITWKKIAEKDNNVLLISEVPLFKSNYYYPNGTGNPGWDGSIIRSSLNGHFFDESFNETEKSMIRVPGEKVFDKIFILSREELKYLSSIESKGCGSPWWLRIESHSKHTANYVDGGGSINSAICVRYFEGEGLYYTEYGVRPAMWVDLELLKQHSNN